jgi:hypothetical protein
MERISAIMRISLYANMKPSCPYSQVTSQKTHSRTYNQLLFPVCDKKAPASPFSKLAFSMTLKTESTDSSTVIGPVKCGAYFRNFSPITAAPF